MDSNTVQISQDKEKYLRQKILEFIRNIEKQYDIKIIYAAETGSRGYGTNVKDSDFDIKGYFICSKEKYLSITGSPEFIDSQHYQLEIDGTVYDVDFEFNDIKVFFKKKTEAVWKNNLNYKFYTEKEDIYIDEFDPNDLQLIKNNMNIDLELWISIIKGYHKHFFFIKNPKPQDKFGKKIRAKDVVNCLVFTGQFVYILEKKQFPPYKYKQLVKELKDINPQVSDLMENQIEIYMNKKRENRVCYVSEQDFPKELEDFLHQQYEQAQKLSQKNQKNKVCPDHFIPQNIEFSLKEAETIFHNLLQKLFQNE